MLAVGPLGPQYSLLFAWHELGRGPIWGVSPRLVGLSDQNTNHLLSFMIYTEKKTATQIYKF